MKKIQSVLGDHQDAVVARGVDRELGIGAHLAGENAFTYGLLYEREDQRAVRLRAKPSGPGSGFPAPGSAIGPDNGLSGWPGTARMSRNGGADPGRAVPAGTSRA